MYPQKHASLYIQPEHYDIVGRYLLEAMKQVLGESLTDEVHAAWLAAYLQLAGLMINREAELYMGAEGWTDWREFSILRKVKESEEITSFYLTPKDGKPLSSYLPGQYISIRTDVPALKYLQARQYSLSDAPSADHYRISVKREAGLDLEHPDAKTHPGYISNILHDIKKVGDEVQLSHPAGEFFLDTRDKKSETSPIALISAGIGLTPDLAILNTLVAENSTRKISWIHAARNSRVDAFGKHVRSIAEKHPNVHYVVFEKHVFHDEVEGSDYHFQGRLRLDELDKDRDLFIHDKGTEYYICGPEKFMADMEEGLLSYGIDEVRIKVELFGTRDIAKV